MAHMASRSKSDGTRPWPDQLLNHPTFMPRLTWKSGPRVPLDPANIADSISQADNASFFCDNSLFHDRLDRSILEALIAVPNKMALSPLVIRELEPWLRNRPRHPLAKAQPLEIDVPPCGAPGRTVYDYYVALLLMRRNAFRLVELEFEQRQGRQATDDERMDLKLRVHQSLGQRGYLLANKGRSSLPTDEQLVYLAVAHAIRTGQPTVVLMIPPMLTSRSSFTSCSGSSTRTTGECCSPSATFGILHR